MPLPTPVTAQDDEPKSGQPKSGQSDPLPTAEFPDPPDPPSLPRMNPDARQPPQRNQDARRKQALSAILGTLSTTAAAATDANPVVFNAAQGLSQGAADQLEARREAFQKEQNAYQEFLDKAQRYNRKARQREAEMKYNQARSRYEQKVDARQSLAEDQRQRQMNRREAERERQLMEREYNLRKELQKIENQGRARRERIEQQGSGSAASMPEMDDLTIPNTVEGIKRQRRRVKARLKALQDNPITHQEFGQTGMQGGEPQFGMVDKQDEEYVEDLNRLRQYLQVLNSELQQRQGGGASQQGQQSPTPRPTSSADTGQSGDSATGQQQGQSDSYNQRLNDVLQQQGRRAALDTLANDLEQGRISPRQADFYFRQVAPDSLQ